MNFDLNTLSTLMQLMGKQPAKEPPRQTEPPRQAEQRVATSSFVRENGIGEKVRIETDSAPSQASASPLSGILELMGGKSGGSDGMSALMPMLMGILGKGDQGGKKSAMTAENKDCHPNDNAPKNVRGEYEDNYNQTGQKHHEKANSSYQRSNEKSQNDRPRAPQGMFAPISYAGYTLISALNLLCRHVYG